MHTIASGEITPCQNGFGGGYTYSIKEYKEP